MTNNSSYEADVKISYTSLEHRSLVRVATTLKIGCSSLIEKWQIMRFHWINIYYRSILLQPYLAVATNKPTS